MTTPHESGPKISAFVALGAVLATTALFATRSYAHPGGIFDPVSGLTAREIMAANVATRDGRADARVDDIAFNVDGEVQRIWFTFDDDAGGEWTIRARPEDVSYTVETNTLVLDRTEDALARLAHVDPEQRPIGATRVPVGEVAASRLIDRTLIDAEGATRGRIIGLETSDEGRVERLLVRMPDAGRGNPPREVSMPADDAYYLPVTDRVLRLDMPFVSLNMASLTPS